MTDWIKEIIERELDIYIRYNNPTSTNAICEEASKKISAEIERRIKESIVESEGIDKYFPKGDKRRGDVLVILALLNIELKAKLGIGENDA